MYLSLYSIPHSIILIKTYPNHSLNINYDITGNPDDDSGIGEELGKKFDDLYVDLVSTETAPLYEGIRETLESLLQDNNDLKYGALSNACGAYVEAVMRENDLTAMFGVQKGADEVPEAKPGGAGLLQCSEILGIDPSACVYVGDSKTDGQAALNAGYHCSVGVSWGSHPVETIKPHFTHIVDSVDELKALLSEIIASSSSSSSSSSTSPSPSS